MVNNRVATRMGMILVACMLMVLGSVCIVGCSGGSNNSSAPAESSAASNSASAVAEESSAAEEPEVEAAPTLGSTIEFDGLEIAFGKEYRTTTVDNQFSDYAGETIIEVPIALTNNSGETKGLNMFYIKVFGPKGTELDNVTAYFQDSDVSWAGEMRNGASMETAFHFPYEGDGTYYIALDKFNEKLEVEIPIQL